MSTSGEWFAPCSSSLLTVWAAIVAAGSGLAPGMAIRIGTGIFGELERYEEYKGRIVGLFLFGTGGIASGGAIYPRFWAADKLKPVGFGYYLLRSGHAVFLQSDRDHHI